MAAFLAAALLVGPMTQKAHRVVHAEPWHHGRASIYARPQVVAAGGWLDPEALTCASNVVPLGRWVEFRRGRRRVVALVNDHMPVKWLHVRKPRQFDLTPGTGRRLGFTDGVEELEWRVVARLGNRRRARR